MGCGIHSATTATPMVPLANVADDSRIWEVQQTQGTLFINTLPASECTVNGVSFGQTPISEEVPVGSYTVICTALSDEPDLLVKLQYAEVQPGETANVLMKLRLDPIVEKPLKWFADDEPQPVQTIAKPGRDELDPKPQPISQIQVSQAPKPTKGLAVEPGF